MASTLYYGRIRDIHGIAFELDIDLFGLGDYFLYAL